jgi:hypothetical protein
VSTVANTSLSVEHARAIAPYTIAATDEADRPFVRSTWRESHKQSPKCDRMKWPAYKATHGRDIDEILAREDTKTLGAYDAEGRLLGWIAWTPGKVPTLHYVYTRHDLDGVKLRRLGVATALLEAAQLGKRVAYTHHGSKRQRGEPLDEMLVAWARAQGVTAFYVEAREFLR